MSYKPITTAPYFTTESLPRGYSIIIDPRQVRSVLMRLGYDWQPSAKLLVKYHDNFRIKEAICYFGSATTKPTETTLYKLKG